MLLCFRFRLRCSTLTEQSWFDFIILVFIASNCITLAMERPNIPPWSRERQILDIANNIFTVVFTIEMALKVHLRDHFMSKNPFEKNICNYPSQTFKFGAHYKGKLQIFYFLKWRFSYEMISSAKLCTFLKYVSIHAFLRLVRIKFSMCFLKENFS